MNKDRAITCCFTGHRSIPKNDLFAVCEQLQHAIRVLYEDGYRHFVAGGALGFDTLAARAVLALKPHLEGITLTLVLPCADQADAWEEKDRAEYGRIKSLADEVVCLAPAYFDGCMQKRNQAMVDASSACIAYLTRSRSGAGQTVRMAEKAGHRILNTAPKRDEKSSDFI